MSKDAIRRAKELLVKVGLTEEERRFALELWCDLQDLALARAREQRPKPRPLVLTATFAMATQLLQDAEREVAEEGPTPPAPDSPRL